MAHVLDTPHAQYLQGQRRGLLATVAPNGAPQNKPVGFRYNTELGTLDIAGTDMERSAKFRNVAVHPQVAFTVDDVSDANAGAAGVRFAEIRGEAEQVELEAPPFRGTPPPDVTLAQSGARRSTSAASRFHRAQVRRASPRWRSTCSSGVRVSGGWLRARTRSSSPIAVR